MEQNTSSIFANFANRTLSMERSKYKQGREAGVSSQYVPSETQNAFSNDLRLGCKSNYRTPLCHKS